MSLEIDHGGPVGCLLLNPIRYDALMNYCLPFHPIKQEPEKASSILGVHEQGPFQMPETLQTMSIC